MKDDKTSCIVSVSCWGYLDIQLRAFVFGLWLIFKRFLKWCWNPKAFFTLNVRDNPPSCLVDSVLGRHLYVKFKGIKLHYVECGSKDMPLVVLLHGFPDFWLSWRYQIPELSKHFRVVAIDLKGFGDSDKPLYRNNYKIGLILAELKHFIHSLGVNSCILIGHDIGGILGWYFVHKYPEIIKKFVVVSCPHPNIYWNQLNENSYLNRKWLYASQLPYLPEIDLLKEDINIINDLYKHLDKEYVDAYKYTFSRKEDWTGPINYFRNLLFYKISDNIEPITIQTLLIIGDCDSQIKLESIVKSTDYCERFSVKIIENSGHFPHQENPAMFNKTVLNFLIAKEIKLEKVNNSGKGIMDRMFGAVSNTVKYGNNVLVDVVQKGTNGVLTKAPIVQNSQKVL